MDYHAIKVELVGRTALCKVQENWFFVFYIVSFHNQGKLEKF